STGNYPHLNVHWIVDGRFVYMRNTSSASETQNIRVIDRSGDYFDVETPIPNLWQQNFPYWLWLASTTDGWLMAEADRLYQNILYGRIFHYKWDGISSFSVSVLVDHGPAFYYVIDSTHLGNGLTELDVFPPVNVTD